MTIKRTPLLSSTRRRVKKTATSAFGLAVLCTSAIAPSAFASDGDWVDRKVTVKFEASALESADGTKDVYTTLRRRALSFCRADRASIYMLGESVSECADDLVAQFVASADKPVLTAYHVAATGREASVKLALNEAKTTETP